MAPKAKSRTLTDHDEIRRWAEARSVRPSTVRRTPAHDNAGMIRLDFPGYSGGDPLQEISWDEWFEDFEDRNLALIVQDQAADGGRSNFNRLANRESVKSESEQARGAGRGTSGRSESQTAKKTRIGSPATASSRSRRSKSSSSEARKTTERNRSWRRKAA